MIKNFIAAARFLTIFSWGKVKTREDDLIRSIPYFPVVGLFLGLALAGVNLLLRYSELGPIAGSVVLVVVSAAVTRGLHIDGLADTADALLSGKKKEDMLKIMRDPHIGAMGVIVIVSVLLLKIAFLSTVNTGGKTDALILLFVLSRWAMVFSMFTFPYARAEGKAKIFMDKIDKNSVVIATLIALGCVALIWTVRSAIAFGAAFGAAYLMNKYISKKIGGITGDTIGAVSEMTEVVVLAVMCIT